MTTDLCAEDVVGQIAPQASLTGVQIQGDLGAGALGGRLGAGMAMELGRRLLLAARAGDTPQVLDLMAKGAPFTTDWLGTSPLHLAASNDHAATCGVLLRAGVSRDSRTKVERTPLHLAAWAGHASVAALLLRHGAAADARDLLRMTPLHWAAQRDHPMVAKVLLQYGADPCAVNKFKQTPLQVAARAGHAAVLAVLEDATRQREAARSVRALVAERLVDLDTAEPQQQHTFATLQKRLVDQDTVEPQQQQTFATLQKLPELKTNILLTNTTKTTKSKITQEKQSIPEEKESSKAEDTDDATGTRENIGQTESTGVSGAAAILKRHGITLLPPDTGGTVLTALQCGRTVVLSDAGKLMLQESVSGATTAKTPARHTNTSQIRPSQLKLIQLPSDASVSTRATKPRSTPVKIIMNKTNFQRLVAQSHMPKLATDAPVAMATEPVAMATDDTDQVADLKRQLAASQKTVARLTDELRMCRAKLAQYEGQ